MRRWTTRDEATVRDDELVKKGKTAAKKISSQ